MNRAFACASLVAAAAAAAALAGCLEPEDDSLQWSETFETGLANWALSGEIDVVTTLHPGEHAAMLDQGAQMEHGLSIARTVGEDSNQWEEGFTDGNWIEYSTDCVGRPALSLEPFTTPPPGDNLVRVRLVIDGPPEGEFRRRKLMFPALPAFIGPPADDPIGSPGEFQLGFRALQIIAAAPCRIDNIYVMVSGGTLAY